LEQQTVELAQAKENADGASTVQPLVDRNANTLEVHRADDLGTMHTDQTKVRQGLFNLLSNATSLPRGSPSPWTWFGRR
jgi:C4-dicarboxylate-specific signal transduction histidine kinase